MDKLLALAVDAHGRLDVWNKFKSLHAHVSIGGALWDMKQVPGLFRNAHVDLRLRDQHVVTHLPHTGQLSGSFSPRPKCPLSPRTERSSTHAQIRGRVLPARPPIPNGINCMPGISAATPLGIPHNAIRLYVSRL